MSFSALKLDFSKAFSKIGGHLSRKSAYEKWKPPPTKREGFYTYQEYLKAMAVLTWSERDAPGTKGLTTVTNAQGQPLTLDQWLSRTRHQLPGGGSYVSSRPDPTMAAITAAHQVKYQAAVQVYAERWWEYNMALHHKSDSEVAQLLTHYNNMGVDNMTNPYYKIVFDHSAGSEWKKTLTTNFNQRYDEIYHADKRSGLVKFFQDTLPGILGPVGDVVAGVVHLEQLAEGKESTETALLGVGDVAGASFGLEGAATGAKQAYTGAHTVPGGVIAAMFSPFSTLEHNKVGKYIEEVFEVTGINAKLNEYEAEIREKKGDAAADSFSVMYHSIANPATAVMMGAYYILASPLELESMMTGDEKGKHDVENFLRDLGFQPYADVAAGDINIGQDVNGLITMALMAKLGSVRAGRKTGAQVRAEMKADMPEYKAWAETELKAREGTPDAGNVSGIDFEVWRRRRDTKQKFGIDDAQYNKLDAEWRDAHSGKAGTVEQLGTLVKQKVKDIVLGEEPTRGVRIDHPGEILPKGWTREFTEEGPVWKGPRGEVRKFADGPPIDKPGYHPGNVIPEDAAIARMFAQDSYRIKGAPSDLQGSGWSEMSGSGRALPRAKFHKYLKSSIEAIQYLEQEHGKMKKQYTPEELKTVDTDLKTVKNNLHELENQLRDLRNEQVDYPQYDDLYERDIAEVKRDLNKQISKFDDLTDRTNYRDNRAALEQIENQIKEYEKHELSDLPEGQEITTYRNESTGEHMVSFRGNEYTGRDYGAIASMAVGLEELNPRMRAAVQSVLDIADNPKYKGEPISLSGQSLGGATVLFTNEWLGLNRPDIPIKKAYTYGAGSSKFGRAGVHWDQYYERHVSDASQWQQRLTNYNIRGDVIAEQPTPYGLIHTYEPFTAGDMTSSRAWQHGYTAWDFLTKKSAKRHWINVYPLEGGKWYSGKEGRAAGYSNMTPDISYYGERPSVKLRVLRKAIKEARPFARPTDPAARAWLDQSGSLECDTDEHGNVMCSFTGDAPSLGGLDTIIESAAVAEQSVKDSATGGGPPGAEETVGGGITDPVSGQIVDETPELIQEKKEVEQALGIQPTGTVIDTLGPSGTQYRCSFNSAGVCTPIKTPDKPTAAGKPSRFGLDIIGFSMMPADTDAVWAMYGDDIVVF